MEARRVHGAGGMRLEEDGEGDEEGGDEGVSEDEAGDIFMLLATMAINDCSISYLTHLQQIGDYEHALVSYYKCTPHMIRTRSY